MRILVLNANTTAFVTERAAAEARRVASSGTEILPVTGDFGAAVMASRVECAIGEHAAVTLAARHAGGTDGVLIAVSYDTGLEALREMLPVPVLGMTEAALLTACTLGARIGLVCFGARVQPLYAERVRRYGLESRIAAWTVLETTAPYSPGDTTALDADLVAAAAGLVVQGAEAVILLGAVMAGASRRIEDRVPVPVLDGIRAGLPLLEGLVRSRYRKPETGSYAPVAGRSLTGVDPAILRLLS
ncbi:aspartate/glutamate racemase family protein [Prosthecomicrobium sp. N25]|uniref:aspartate/glutamate racemase family protein n=1 Tax=Prosthecomicrobium sp. N25 TaxID=3129254 RepID=UPI0030782D4C